MGALAQFVEELAVLDRDNGLRGEVRDQLDLLVGEGTNFLAEDRNRADQFFVLKHWHHDKSARTCTSYDAGPTLGIVGIYWFRLNVRDLDRLPCLDNACERRPLRYSDPRVAPPLFRVCRRSSMQRHHAKCIAFVQEKHTELCFADSGGISQHSVEYRL